MSVELDEIEDQVDGGQIGLAGQRKVVLELVSNGRFREHLHGQIEIRQGRRHHQGDSIKRGQPPLGVATLQEARDLDEHLFAIPAGECRLLGRRSGVPPG
jgi:hypothetical protein